ncbi:MAG: hypothetical protein BPHS0_04 [Phage 5P_3]|nr:MAG: hypothetical protein BPHS0_04 [Phage 5P_3]
MKLDAYDLTCFVGLAATITGLFCLDYRLGLTLGGAILAAAALWMAKMRAQ